MSEPREWWIRPADEPRHQNNFGAVVLDKPYHGTGGQYAEKIIHVIEKSAYDALKAELEQFENLNKAFQEGVDNCCKHTAEIDSLRAEVERLKGSTGGQALTLMEFTHKQEADSLRKMAEVQNEAAKAYAKAMAHVLRVGLFPNKEAVKLEVEEMVKEARQALEEK